MIPWLICPWMPQQMVLVGLPLVAELIWLVQDALCAAEEPDAVLSNQLPTAHQLAMGLLFLRAPRLFLARDAQAAALLARSATFAIALAIKPVAHHTAILPVAECDRVLDAKSLPCLQC